jgi:nitrate reductase NapE component
MPKKYDDLEARVAALEAKSWDKEKILKMGATIFFIVIQLAILTLLSIAFFGQYVE